MAATIVLELGLTEAYSSEFTVIAGQLLTVSIFNNNGATIPNGFQLWLQRKTANNHFLNITTLDYGQIALRYNIIAFVINGEGTYRVYRPNLTSVASLNGMAIGVQVGWAALKIIQ